MNHVLELMAPREISKRAGRTFLRYWQTSISFFGPIVPSQQSYHRHRGVNLEATRFVRGMALRRVSVRLLAMLSVAVAVGQGGPPLPLALS